MFLPRTRFVRIITCSEGDMASGMAMSLSLSYVGSAARMLCLTNVQKEKGFGNVKKTMGP